MYSIHFWPVIESDQASWLRELFLVSYREQSAHVFIYIYLLKLQSITQLIDLNVLIGGDREASRQGVNALLDD